MNEIPLDLTKPINAPVNQPAAEPAAQPVIEPVIAVTAPPASPPPPAPPGLLAGGPSGPASGADTPLIELLQRPLTIAVITLAVLLAAQTWSTHNQMRTLREDVARRLQNGDASNAETGNLARTVQESARELQAKVAVLENRQTEAQSQQLALEQLYQDLSKNRDEWALTEIEQVLSTASQQLQLAGNVPGALIALQNADRSLSRSDKPQFITIRRAIGRDTDKLKALPMVDSTGVALRLDAVIAQMDTLPMLSDEKPVRPALLAKTPSRFGKATQPDSVDDAAALNAPSSATAPVASGWTASLQHAWNSWTSEMWNDIRELIRVRSVDTPEALMLSPNQAYFLRENVKLRLLNARMALLSRNEAAFRSDLIAAQEALVKYFDVRAKQTQTVQALLRQVQSSNLAIDMPTLSDSLNAVRNYKAKP